MCTCIHTYLYTYIHTYIHTYTHTSYLSLSTVPPFPQYHLCHSTSLHYTYFTLFHPPSPSLYLSCRQSFFILSSPFDLALLTSLMRFTGRIYRRGEWEQRRTAGGRSPSKEGSRKGEVRTQVTLGTATYRTKSCTK